MHETLGWDMKSNVQDSRLYSFSHCSWDTVPWTTVNSILVVEDLVPRRALLSVVCMY